MLTKIENFVQIFDHDWPKDKELEVWPGDLNLFALMGFGMKTPLLLRPWDDPLSASSVNYYEAIAHTFHPMGGAPRTRPTGGTIWFDAEPAEADVQALLRLMGIHAWNKEYAVFAVESDCPNEEQYLLQLRIVSRFALTYLFRAITETESKSFPEQKLSIGELIWKFIEDQQEVLGIYETPQLDGLMGGDGDWAKEHLAFGLMVENNYYGVYRIWSRAWLVTK